MQIPGPLDDSMEPPKYAGAQAPGADAGQPSVCQCMHVLLQTVTAHHVAVHYQCRSHPCLHMSMLLNFPM